MGPTDTMRLQIRDSRKGTPPLCRMRTPTSAQKGHGQTQTRGRSTGEAAHTPQEGCGREAQRKAGGRFQVRGDPGGWAHVTRGPQSDPRLGGRRESRARAGRSSADRGRWRCCATAGPALLLGDTPVPLGRKSIASQTPVLQKKMCRHRERRGQTQHSPGADSSPEGAERKHRGIRADGSGARRAVSATSP